VTDRPILPVSDWTAWRNQVVAAVKRKILAWWRKK